MKKIVFFCFCAFTIWTANAQKDLKTLAFSFGLNTSLPTGSYSKMALIGKGGNLQLAYRFIKSAEAVVQANFDFFQPKTFWDEGSLTALGLVGARFYATQHILVGMNAGHGTFVYGDYPTKSGMAISPEIGYTSENFQALMNYSSFNTDYYGKISFIGFRLSYIL